MPCFSPIRGYRSAKPNENGRYPVVFSYQHGEADRAVTLPCGQCVGCRLERSKQWALRCVHEASLYERNCFLTMTYREDALPIGMSLNIEDWQLFMKRLKSQVRRSYGKTMADGIRFYMCGEYGTRYGRPHYHACIFNFDFPDKTYKRFNQMGDKIYSSALLDRLWGLGQCEIGAVTMRSAAYVARYIMKKVTGDAAEQYYWYVDADGVVHDRKPEFTNMSRKYGIGKGWLDKFQSDVFPRGFVEHDGVRHRVPRFYDSLYEITNPQEMQRLRGKRIRGAKKHVDDQSLERRRVREKVQQLRLERLKREID